MHISLKPVGHTEMEWTVREYRFGDWGFKVFYDGVGVKSWDYLEEIRWPGEDWCDFWDEEGEGWDKLKYWRPRNYEPWK
jgi:hypothetical protein